MGGLNKWDDLAARLASEANPSVIRAYHGSPYDWDKPDMSMVGRGEGPHLDEGFGLYGSSKEGVGNWYRHHTTRIRRDQLAEQLRTIRKDTDASPMDPHELGKELDWHRRLQNARRLAETVRPQLQRLQRQHPRGRTYELEVAVPRDSLMEWDAPLSYQSPEVLEKLRSVNPQIVDDWADSPDGSAAMFYRVLAGGSVFDTPSVRQQRRASEALFDAGIPGHAYQGQVENYVFYPGIEDQIRILRKYAVPGAVGTGVASQYGEE
jgi:hypothetical protein